MAERSEVVNLKLLSKRINIARRLEQTAVEYLVRDISPQRHGGCTEEELSGHLCVSSASVVKINMPNIQLGNNLYGEQIKIPA